MPMKATDKVFPLRLPIEMYEFFKEQAEKNERSVNYEILTALKERRKKLEKDKKPNPLLPE